MNIEKVYDRFKAFETIFKCPICSGQMSFRNKNSIVCSNSHCYDLSKYGYINFSPNQSKTMYTRELFESRRHIFRSGFYTPLKEIIGRLIQEYSGTSKNTNILDAGCGEGFFVPETPEIAGLPYEVFALDLLKDAVILASKENADVKWMVGDLANIPLQTGSIDILTNIFAPANYGEFLRVMTDGGAMIKAIPGERYLAELRESAKEQLSAKEYSGEPVSRYFSGHMTCVDKRRLFYQLPVTRRDLEHFVRMTPMMFNVDKDKVELGGIEQITIDVEIMIGKKSSRTDIVTPR